MHSKCDQVSSPLVLAIGYLNAGVCQLIKFHLILLFWNWILFQMLFPFMLSQYFVEAGAIAVRRVRKEDLRHVAKATGATVVCFLFGCLKQ